MDDPHCMVTRKIADEMKEKGSYEFLEVGFMNFCLLTIEEAFQKVIKKGAKKVLFVGGIEFLGEGSHPLVDLPKTVEEIAKKYPDIQVKYAPPSFKPFSKKIVNMLIEKVEKESKIND